MERITNNPVLTTLCMILYMSGIIILSHIPSSDLQTGFEFNDKAAHIILYMGLGFFMMRFFKKVMSNKISRAAVMTLVFGTIFAITDEIHQGFVGYFDTGIFGGARNPEVADVAADTVGLLISCIIYFFLNKLHTIYKTKIQE